jgi:phenylpropionate dioxygenase-like ring-hydroxylating dioxygenase large terminal subunit
MLTPQENERITRIGPGTPMGAVFRRYWQPAALSEELPERDGAPIRVRLLGEDLVAFRDSTGGVGLIDAFCPHRRAPMFFGRNEDCGLRCVYHGWKFDSDGNCVDMPSEPADSLFKTKVRIAAYPTFEAGGVVWAYLGPAGLQPPVPDYEWLRVPASHRHINKTYEEANWLQALEGGLDTSHSSFAHNMNINDKKYLRNADTAPRLEVDRTDYGFRYAGIRSFSDRDYVRVYHYIMPAQALRGGVTSWNGIEKADVPRLDGHIWVPIDDTTTWAWNMVWSYDEKVPITDEWHAKDEARFGRGVDDLIPGTFKLKKNLANDFMIDRQVQKTKTFTGIVGINTQDMALQEGMGPICDRSKEHLGTTDKAIIACRQLLLEATQAVEDGKPPRGVDPSSYERVRPYDAVVPVGKVWETEFAPELVAKF